MTRTVLVVQNSADDPPGRLADWLGEAGCALRVYRGHLDEELPENLDGWSGLIVLGGAMNAYDDVLAPWLPQVRALLAQAVEQELPTLGVCLGHQLLAVATGGRVAPAEHPQTGVVEVGLTVAGGADALLAGVPHRAPAVHWNNDVVVEAPPAAVVLAESVAGVQALRVGARGWGIQFHPEVDIETVTGWAGADVVSGALTAQHAVDCLAGITAAADPLARVWRDFGHRFADQVRPR